MKKIIRKVAAVGAGVAMLGSTLGGAVAVSMDDMSGTFGVASTAYVVGSDAGTNDDSARDVLANYFGGFVESDLSGESHTENDVPLATGNLSATFGEVDDDDFNGLLYDTELDVNGTDYDIREYFSFTTGAQLLVGGETGGEDDFGANPYLVYGAGSIKYLFDFGAAGIPAVNVDADEPIKFDFLGKEIEITGISATNHTVTLNFAEEFSVTSGESITFDGKTVTVDHVYESSVSVNVDGVSEIVTETGSYEDVGEDLEIDVTGIGYDSNNPALSTAVIKIQSQSSDTTVSDSDAFELFEEFDTESHAPWEWQINNTDEELFEIGIVNAHNSDDIDDDDYQTDPIGLGESIVFPGNYAEISFDSLEDADYASFSVSTGETDFDDGDGNTQTNAMYVEFVSEDGDYFEFSDNTDTDTVYFVWYNLSDDASFEVWYLDSNGAEEYWSTNDYVTIDYNDNQDYVLDASSIDNSTDAVIMTINTVAGSELNLTWNASTDNGWFGLTEDAESADLTYRGSGIGVEDYDVLFADGFYVETPESDLDSNEINFNVPSGDVTATFSIKVVSSTTEFEPVLKTEAAAADYDKLILVGGPCVNTLTADYLGLPVNSCEADSGIAADAALVELVEKDGKTALIVAGYEKADTLRAANAVAAGGLTGTSMIV